MGYKTDGTLSDADQSKYFEAANKTEKRMVVLEKKDLQSPLKRAPIISMKTFTFNYVKWYQDSFGNPTVENEEIDSDYSGSDWSSDESQESNIQSKLATKNMRSARHKILHFIPSAQMKILKGILYNLNFRFLA